jgi:hypothetical protein
MGSLFDLDLERTTRAVERRVDEDAERAMASITQYGVEPFAANLYAALVNNETAITATLKMLVELGKRMDRLETYVRELNDE